MTSGQAGLTSSNQIAVPYSGNCGRKINWQKDELEWECEISAPEKYSAADLRSPALPCPPSEEMRILQKVTSWGAKTGV